MEVSYDDGRSRAPGIKKIALAGDSLLTALGLQKQLKRWKPEDRLNKSPIMNPSYAVYAWERLHHIH